MENLGLAVLMLLGVFTASVVFGLLLGFLMLGR